MKFEIDMFHELFNFYLFVVQPEEAGPLVFALAICLQLKVVVPILKF